MSDYETNADLNGLQRKKTQKMAGDIDDSLENRKSSRTSRKMHPKDKEWCLFYFNVGEKSLASVPKSWVSAYRKNVGNDLYKTYHKCWWPQEGSNEVTKTAMAMLVRNCSEPDYQKWQQLKGKCLANYQELEKCEAALSRREGASTTDTENNIEMPTGDEHTMPVPRKKPPNYHMDQQKSHKANEITVTLPAVKRSRPTPALKITLTSEERSTPVSFKKSKNKSENTGMQSAVEDGQHQSPHHLGLPTTSKSLTPSAKSLAEAQKIEPRRCLSGIFEEDNLEEKDISPVTLLDARQLHEIQTGNGNLHQKMIDAFHANMKLFMEQLNRNTSTLEKLLIQKNQSAHKRSYYEEDENASFVIRKMASSKPEVRATVNHMQCIEILGFPVTTSREDLKKANNNLISDETNSKCRRNALVNILKIVAPKIDGGKKTIQSVVRECLYSIARVYLWQFYSSQGKSGTSRYSFREELPHIYSAVMVAAIKQSGLTNTAVISAIGIVLRGCPTRKESIKFRSQHPDQFSDTEKSKTPQGKAIAIAKERKRELARVSGSEDSEQDMTTHSPEEPARKRQSLYTHKVMAKAISSIESSEEDSDSNMTPPTVRHTVLDKANNSEQEEFEEAESELDDSDNDRYIFG